MSMPLPMLSKGKVNKDELIDSILDEIKELELITEGMRDPATLRELALKKTRSLLLLYEQLKETDNAGSSSTIVQAETDKQVPATVLIPKDESEETKKADTSTQTESEEKNNVEAANDIKGEETTKSVTQTVFQKIEIESEQQPQIKDVDSTIEETGVAQKQETEQENVSRQNYTPAAIRDKTIVTTNDKFKAKQPVQTVTPSIKRMDSRFVQSLKTAINLNDRFRYRNILFGGDATLMESTISTIDNMCSKEEAINYMDQNFSWDKNDDTTSEFYELVEKRFS